MFVRFFFFVKQKTAYEMRIRDWSSDVCPSDLIRETSPSARSARAHAVTASRMGTSKRNMRSWIANGEITAATPRTSSTFAMLEPMTLPAATDRKSVGQGKSVYVRVDRGGRRSIE